MEQGKFYFVIGKLNNGSKMLQMDMDKYPYKPSFYEFNNPTNKKASSKRQACRHQVPT